jgi:GNAT superfamily N-acetyltransferase
MLLPGGKRVHRSSSSSTSSSSDEDDQQRQQLCNQTPIQFIARGTSCIHLAFSSCSSSTHTPLFAHQALSPDGRALGYKDLSINLRFSHQWRVLATQTFSEQHPSFVDPLGDPLQRIVASPHAQLGVNGFTTNPTEFDKWIKGENAGEFAWPGEIVPVPFSAHTLHWVDSCVAIPDFLARCQGLGFWLIETAEHVDSKDENFALAYCTVGGVDLAGYLLLYRFRTMRSAQPLTWRICQLAVAPPFASQGIGRALIRFVHWKANKANDVYEVSVEDPCDMYSRLRLLVDYEACSRAGVFASNGACDFHKLVNVKNGKVGSEVVDRVRRELKICERQVQLCLEVAWRARVVARGGSEEDEKTFRTCVKRRLYGENEEDMDPNAVDFKQVLHDMYESEVALFDSVLRACEKNKHAGV